MANADTESRAGAVRQPVDGARPRIASRRHYAALGLAVAITLWGDGADHTTAGDASGADLEPREGEESKPFRETNSVAGPLLASAATAFAFALSALVADGWTGRDS